MQITRIAGVELDLAAQPGYLHTDVATVAAELPGFRQLLTRYRLPRLRCQDGKQAGLGGGQMHDAVAAEQLAAGEIEAIGAATHRPLVGLPRPAPLADIADAQHQLARLGRLRQGILAPLPQAVHPSL